MNKTAMITWIPVEERLPEIGVDALLSMKSGDQRLAKWTPKTGFITTPGRWSLPIESVTHWAELPTHPSKL